MKDHKKPMGLMLTGRMPKSKVTIYCRQGDFVMRSVHSEGKRHNTRQQFIQRQRMRHSIALWRVLKPCQPLFTHGKTNYNGFITLANQLPAVFIPYSLGNGNTLLLPDMPVSDGTLPPIKQWLGEVDGTAALITNLKADTLRDGEKLMLYTATQSARSVMVSFKVREVMLEEFAEVDGCLALVDNDFSDEMKGWALVRVNGELCSSQGIVTRCTYYEQFTTEEALQKAAQSYGGLTKE